MIASLAADENVTVTAGIGGFLAFFFLALALWLLMRNMFARLRRMRYREEARIEAEQREAGLAGDDDAPDGPDNHSDDDIDDSDGDIDDSDGDGRGGTGPASTTS